MGNWETPGVAGNQKRTTDQSKRPRTEKKIPVGGENPVLLRGEKGWI